jgi:CheY-like chemotaxis protein
MESEARILVVEDDADAAEAMNGFDYAVKIRQDRELAATPILMITAVNVRHPGFGFYPESDGEYLPVDDFIDKPAQPRELAEKVRRLLAQKTSKWKDWPDKADQGG